MGYNVKEYKDNIYWIDVETESGIKARLSTFGASVYSLSVFDEPVILTLKNEDEFLNCPQYFGKTLGRVCGRVRCDGTLDNVPYHLLQTKDFDYCLHAGDDKSLSYKNFDFEVKDNKKEIVVIFKIKDKDGTNGFPGTAKIKVAYKFSKVNPELKIVFNGKTDKTTLMNLSNHMYFNFSRDLDLKSYSLKMNASKYGLTDDTVFIIETKEVPDYLDFRKMCKINPKFKAIRNSPLKTIDNTFIFDEINFKNPQVILKNDKIQLSLYTDYPAMNIYLDNSLTNVEFTNRSDFKEARGIALEPQLYNLDLNSLILRKGDTYNHFIKYKFKKLK